jgi:hypothetical protein
MKPFSSVAGFTSAASKGKSGLAGRRERNRKGIRTCSRQLLRDGHCSGEGEKEKEHNERTHGGGWGPSLGSLDVVFYTHLGTTR